MPNCNKMYVITEWDFTINSSEAKESGEEVKRGFVSFHLPEYDADL